MLTQRLIPAEILDEISQLAPVAEAGEDETPAPLLLLGEPEERQADGQGNLPNLDVHRTADHLLVRNQETAGQVEMEMRALRIAGAEHAAPQEDAPVREPLGPLGVKGQFPLLRHSLSAQSLPAVQVVAQAFLRERLAALGKHRFALQRPGAVRHPGRLDDAVAGEVVHLRGRKLDAGGLHLGLAVQGHLLLPDVKEDAVRRRIDDGILSTRSQGVRRRQPLCNGQWLRSGRRTALRGVGAAAEDEPWQVSRIGCAIQGVVAEGGEIGEPTGWGREQGNGLQAGTVERHADFRAGRPVGLGKRQWQAVRPSLGLGDSIGLGEIEGAPVAHHVQSLQTTVSKQAVKVPASQLMVELPTRRTGHEGVASDLETFRRPVREEQPHGIPGQLVRTVPHDGVPFEVHPPRLLGPGQAVRRRRDLTEMQSGPRSGLEGPTVGSIGDVHFRGRHAKGVLSVVEPGHCISLERHVGPHVSVGIRPIEADRVGHQPIGGGGVAQDDLPEGQPQTVSHHQAVRQHHQGTIAEAGPSRVPSDKPARLRFHGPTPPRTGNAPAGVHHLGLHGKVETPPLGTVTHGFRANLHRVDRHRDGPIEFHGPRLPVIPSGPAFDALRFGGHHPSPPEAGQAGTEIIRGALGGQGSRLPGIGGIDQLDFAARHPAQSAVGHQLQHLPGQNGGTIRGLDAPHQAESAGRIPPRTVAHDLGLPHGEKHIAHQPLGLDDGRIPADFRGAPNLHLDGLRQGDERQDQKAP